MGSVVRARDLAVGLRRYAWIAALATSVVAAAACGSSGDSSTSGATTVSVTTGGAGGALGGGGAATSTGQGGDGQGAGGSGAAPTGLPCDVADVLASACASCHGSVPKGGATMSLLSYADLTAPSAKDPGQSYAARSVTRMQDAQSPMPPGAGVTMTPAQIASFQAFIDAGYPKGGCGAPDGGAPPPDGGGVDFPNDPPKCTSNLTWFLGNSGGALMNPGKACNECHKQKGKVVFAVAGTVYPTGHEPDLCVGSGANGAVIEITDKNGQKTSLKANYSGNFSAKSIAGFALPYTAKVLFNGGERAMLAPQTNGDCNSCHTQDGTSSAPGRIRLP